MAAPDAPVRQSIAQRLREARAWTDGLFRLLTPAGLLERPIAERHRLLFYVGHLEAFDWNLICRDVLGERSSRPTFEQLFAFGIDPVDGNLPSDQPSDWPQLEELQAWNRELREAVDRAIESAPLTGWLAGGWALHLALEHRLMHAETLAYLLQRMDVRFKVAGPLPEVTSRAADTSMVRIEAGTTSPGLSRRTAPYLGWDNEYEAHHVEVPAFELARLPVSNAQWLEFVEAGGYRERTLWSDEAWTWKEHEAVTHPAFWTQRDSRWWWRAMFGEVPLPESWPVYVSHAEAQAYARWKQARLPTEPEWHRAIEGLRPQSWLAGVHGNFGGKRFDPVSSGTHPAGETRQGIADLIGNGWEWTSTVFAPFAGFEPLPFYPAYSANFFDGKHFVMKGASAMTDLSLLRPSFRNWFQPHYQHMFAKFRLAKGGSDA